MRYMRLLEEREERAAEAHHDMWRAFDEPVRWLWELELRLASVRVVLQSLARGTVHEESTEKECEGLDDIERLLEFVRWQVDASRVRAATEAQLAVYHEGLGAEVGATQA